MKRMWRAPDGLQVGWIQRAGHAVHLSRDGRRALCGQKLDRVGPQAFGALCKPCSKLVPPQRNRR